MKEATTLGGIPSTPLPEGDSVVRPTPKENARRGRRATVGENCHGPQLDDGLALMVECIHKFCLLQSQRAPSEQLGPEVPASECEVCFGNASRRPLVKVLDLHSG
ncbi:hypothetical protein DVH05_026735 [Phytophthora capsici]|nr:hypothetical protein DVH05_026735 [Phytophthora capsici]